MLKDMLKELMQKVREINSSWDPGLDASNQLKSCYEDMGYFEIDDEENEEKVKILLLIASSPYIGEDLAIQILRVFGLEYEAVANAIAANPAVARVESVGAVILRKVNGYTWRNICALAEGPWVSHNTAFVSMMENTGCVDILEILLRKSLVLPNGYEADECQRLRIIAQKRMEIQNG